MQVEKIIRRKISEQKINWRDTATIRCNRCNHKLKYPIYINQRNYGKTCAKKIQMDLKYNLREWI